MKKIFTFAAALLASLSMMAAVSVTVPTSTFTLPDLESTWTWAGKVDNAYVTKGDTLIFNTYELYQTKSTKQPWYAAVGGGTSNADWAAQGCFVGAAGWTINGVKENHYATVKNATDRLHFYRVTNCNGALALVKSGSNKKRTIYLEAYELTAGVAAATPAASDNWEENTEHIIAIEGLDVTKEYVIALYAIGTGTGGSSEGNSNIYEIAFVSGVAATKYTVTYMDGETVLGTETVKENETATKASTHEAKAHATFDGWFNDAEFTSPADFTAAITADKTFYGKWTADAFTASTSINIEQLVLDNGKSYDIAGALTAAHIAYANIDALDSLSSKADRNEPYLGLKLKTAGAYVEMGLNAGDVLRVKFGNVAADVKVNGVTVAKADLAAPYEHTATAQEYVRIETTTSGTVVLKQIKVNEAISPISLPGDENNTKLATLTLDGVAIEGFAADKTTYNIILAEGAAIPVVAATAAAAGAVVSEITQATAIPGAATFTVTAADGTTTATYTINFSNLSAAKVLTNVKFSNGAYGAIDETAHTITVAYMGTMPTVDATSLVVSEGANAAVGEGVITVTAEDASTQDYTIAGQELVASATVDQEITFDGTESYIYAHYGWDAEKGVKFAKKVDEATNMRIAKGNTRIYMALPAAKEVVLTSGTGGARDVKIYVDGVEYTAVVKTAASGQTITIDLNENAASFLMIESNQTGGDGGFTKMQLNSSLPTGLNNVEAAKAIKVIENGQIVIIKNGVRYNAVGAKL